MGSTLRGVVEPEAGLRALPSGAEPELEAGLEAKRYGSAPISDHEIGDF